MIEYRDTADAGTPMPESEMCREMKPTPTLYRILQARLYDLVMSTGKQRTSHRMPSKLSKVTLLPTPGLYARQPKPDTPTVAWAKVEKAFRTSLSESRGKASN